MAENGWGLDPWGQTPWGGGAPEPPPNHQTQPVPTLISGPTLDQGLGADLNLTGYGGL